MPIGYVKWWNDDSGYGFIVQSAGPDVFVHYSEIQGQGYPTLTEGQRIEYEIREGPRGPMAIHVRTPGDPIGPASGDHKHPPQDGVRLFAGDSLRLIEYEINEWADMVDVLILNVSLVAIPDKGYRALVAYCRRAVRDI